MTVRSTTSGEEGGARGGHGFAGRGDDQVPILDDEAAPEPGDEAAEELVVGFGGLDARGEDPAAHRGRDGGVQIRAGGDGLGDRGQGLPSPAHVARLAQGRGGVDGRGLQGHRAGGGVTGEAAEREAAPEIKRALPLLGDLEDELGRRRREWERGPGGGEGERGGVVGVADPVENLEALPPGSQLGHGPAVDLDLERQSHARVLGGSGSGGSGKRRTRPAGNRGPYRASPRLAARTAVRAMLVAAGP